MDDDGFPRRIDVHLLSSSDIQIPQIALKLLVGGLQVKESLQQRRLKTSCCKWSADAACWWFDASLSFCRMVQMRALSAACETHLRYRLLKCIGLCTLLLADLLPG